jgi:hypothetical protein
VLPASGKSPPPFEPGKEPFDLPAAFVAAQFSTVLDAIALRPADALGSDKVDAALNSKTSAQGAAVPSPIGNQSRGKVSYESSVESSLGEHTVESVSSINIDSERKTMAVCNCHDLRCPTSTARPHAGPPFFAGT